MALEASRGSKKSRRSYEKTNEKHNCNNCICLLYTSPSPRDRSNNQDKKVTSSKKHITDDKEAIKQKQLAYLKKHEQEIIDLVKAQSPKVESVQIDWEETQWSDGGLTNPEYYINVFGRINNIEESGWGVDIPINNDESVNLEEMIIGNYISIEGEPID